jgi:hypothetical protein
MRAMRESSRNLDQSRSKRSTRSATADATAAGRASRVSIRQCVPIASKRQAVGRGSTIS